LTILLCNRAFKLPLQSKPVLWSSPCPPEATQSNPAVLLTIIGETVLKDRIVQLLKSHSVSGYTINQVQGEGSQGRRDMASYNTNIEVKTIVSPEVSDAIPLLHKRVSGSACRDCLPT